MKIKLLIALSLGMLFTGCSFKNQEVTVEYKSDNVSGNKKGVVCLNRLEDIRADKSRIGAINNSSGMKTADVVTNQDVTELISKALERELKNLGYTVNVVDVEYAKGVSNVNNCSFIDGKLETFFVQHDFGVTTVNSKSVITVNMTIQNKNGKEFSKKYSTDGDSTTFAGKYGSLFKDSADEALKDLILNIKSDISSVIEK